MDLGLEQLTDDQLLELVQEACHELAARDPYVRGMAQHTITTEADRVTLQRAMLKEAVTAVAGAYVEQIRKETFDEVREGVRAGTIRLLTPAQEARALVESTLAAKIKLIDETVTAIQTGKHPGAEPAIQPRPSVTNTYPGGPDPRDYAAWLKMREREIREQEMLRKMMKQPPFVIPKKPSVP